MANENEIPIEVMRELCESSVEAERLPSPTAYRRRADALHAYRAAKAAAQPKLRTRAEVDAEKVSLVDAICLRDKMLGWNPTLEERMQLQGLCREVVLAGTRLEPPPERMTEALKALSIRWQRAAHEASHDPSLQTALYNCAHDLNAVCDERRGKP